jgi:rod shape-determining protein MreD
MHDRIGFSVPALLAATIPFACGVIGAVLANIPVSLVGGLLPPPLLAFMPVYFWCLVRPDLMPPPAALALGALEDLLSGGAMGIWALSFVVAYALVDRERDSFAGLSGIGAILGFAAAVSLVGTVAFVIVAVTYGHFTPLGPVMLQAALTIVLYFPGLWLLNLLHHRLIGPLRSDF